MVILSCLLLSLMAGCSEDVKKDEVKEKDNKASTEEVKDNGGESTKNGQTELKTAPEPVEEEPVEEEPSESYAIGVQSMTQHMFLEMYNNLAIVLDAPALLEEATIAESTKEEFDIYMNDYIMLRGNKDIDGNLDMLTIACTPNNLNEFGGECELAVSTLLILFMPEVESSERLKLVSSTLGMTEMRSNGVEDIRDVTYGDYIMEAYTDGNDTMLFSINHKDNPKYQ